MDLVRYGLGGGACLLRMDVFREMACLSRLSVSFENGLA